MIAEWRTALVTFLVVSVHVHRDTFLRSSPNMWRRQHFFRRKAIARPMRFASIFSMRGPGVLYIGLLKSRSVQDDMINRLGLLQAMAHDQLRNLHAESTQPARVRSTETGLMALL